MSETEMSNLEVKYNLLIKTLLIAGGLNWGTTALGYNVVAGLSRGINRLVKRNLYIDKIVYKYNFIKRGYKYLFIHEIRNILNEQNTRLF